MRAVVWLAPWLALVGCRARPASEGPPIPLAPRGPGEVTEGLDDVRTVREGITPVVAEVPDVRLHDMRPFWEKQYRAWALVPEHWRQGVGFVPLENVLRDGYGRDLAERALLTDVERAVARFGPELSYAEVELWNFRAIVNARDGLRTRFEAGERGIPAFHPTLSRRVEIAKGVVIEQPSLEEIERREGKSESRVDTESAWAEPFLRAVTGGFARMPRVVKGQGVLIGPPEPLPSDVPAGATGDVQIRLLLVWRDRTRAILPIRVRETRGEDWTDLGELDAELRNAVRAAFARLRVEVRETVESVSRG